MSSISFTLLRVQFRVAHASRVLVSVSSPKQAFSLSVAREKVRDGEDAIAGTRDACATGKELALCTIPRSTYPA
jgi:hypothetical protein